MLRSAKQHVQRHGTHNGSRTGRDRDVAALTPYDSRGAAYLAPRLEEAERIRRTGLVHAMCHALGIKPTSPGRYAQIARISSVGGSQLGVNANHLAGWEAGRSGRDDKLSRGEMQALSRKFPELKFPWDDAENASEHAA